MEPWRTFHTIHLRRIGAWFPEQWPWGKGLWSSVYPKTPKLLSTKNKLEKTWNFAACATAEKGAFLGRHSYGSRAFQPSCNILNWKMNRIAALLSTQKPARHTPVQKSLGNSSSATLYSTVFEREAPVVCCWVSYWWYFQVSNEANLNIYCFNMGCRTLHHPSHVT